MRTAYSTEAKERSNEARPFMEDFLYLPSSQWPRDTENLQTGGRFSSFIIRSRIFSLCLHLKAPSFYYMFSNLLYTRLSHSVFFRLSLFVFSATVASKSHD